MSLTLPRPGPAVALALVPLLLITLTGCDQFRDAFAPKEVDDCPAVQGNPSADGLTAQGVVLVDRSAWLCQVEEGVLDLTEKLAELFVDEEFYALPGRRLVTLGLFDGETARSSLSTWEVPDSDAVDARVEADLADFQACLQEVYLPENLAQGPLREGSDVLGALTDGEAAFVRGSGKDDGVLRELAVVTDGRTNSGCLDLVEHATEWALATEVAAEAADRCRGSGAWPEHDLTGVDLEFHLWMTSHDSDSRQGDAWLYDLWQEVCASSSAACDVRSPEGVDGEDRFPGSEGPRDFPEDAAAEIPGWKPACEPQELAGDLLFPHDSATPLPGAADLLAGLADHNRDCVDGTVTVTGHTDSQGSAEYNDALSLRRAEYVAQRLLGHGFIDVVAVGRGEHELVCSGDYDGNDDVNDECPASNRRVVVEFPEMTEG
jgi:outer membrane protein OmpA-like peptidoglycan-associated protein